MKRQTPEHISSILPRTLAEITAIMRDQNNRLAAARERLERHFHTHPEGCMCDKCQKPT